MKIEELAEKSLKTKQISDFEIDDYIEKNQDKFENLLENRRTEIENEIVENAREDIREAFSVFQNFINQYARKNIHQDIINFEEAQQLTVKSFSEIQATSKNFLNDFIENLKNKVQEIIASRKDKQNVKANKIQAR